MLRKAIAMLASVALAFVVGCADNPGNSSGPNSTTGPQTQSIDKNYSNPGENPGLSGAAPQPQTTTGTTTPAGSQGQQ